MTQCLGIFLMFTLMKLLHGSSESDAFTSWASKQTYEAVRGQNAAPPASMSECEVVNFWSLHRHGTRYPKPSESQQMKDLLVPLQMEILANNASTLGNEDLEAIKNWTFNEDLLNKANNLTSVGWSESYNTGVRFGQNFIKGEFDVYLRSTVDSWTQASLKALYTGVKTGNNVTSSSFDLADPQDTDLVLAPYDECAAWNDYQNGTSSVIPNEFLQSDIFNLVISRVSERLGVTTLTSSTITSIWEICRLYRVAFPEEPAPWCAALGTSDFTTLEYYDDMFQYHYAGYGSELNAKLGCHPLQNLLQNFESSVNDNVAKKANMYVAHLTITEMVMAALGIADGDGTLNTANAEKLIVQREYRTNKYLPYAANFAAALYNCSGEYYVQIFQNELKAEIQDGVVLTWDEFKEKFQQYSDCDLCYC